MRNVLVFSYDPEKIQIIMDGAGSEKNRKGRVGV